MGSWGRPSTLPERRLSSYGSSEALTNSASRTLPISAEIYMLMSFFKNKFSRMSQSVHQSPAALKPPFEQNAAKGGREPSFVMDMQSSNDGYASTLPVRFSQGPRRWVRDLRAEARQATPRLSSTPQAECFSRTFHEAAVRTGSDCGPAREPCR